VIEFIVFTLIQLLYTVYSRIKEYCLYTLYTNIGTMCSHELRKIIHNTFFVLMRVHLKQMHVGVRNHHRNSRSIYNSFFFAKPLRIIAISKQVDIFFFF